MSPATHTLVNTGLQTSGFVAVSIEVRHAVGKNTIYCGLCQVSRNANTHLFTEIVLRIGNDYRKQLLTEQDGRNNHQDMSRR